RGDTFDLIFIDGDHRHPQVQRDVDHALASLSAGGCVVMHDCLPLNAAMATLERQQNTWCGTVWRVFAKLRERPDIDCVCGDFDFGAGIVRVVPNTALIVTGKSSDEMTWDDFVNRRAEWMRPVSRTFILALAEEPWQ